MTPWSGSERRGKVSPYFSRNFVCLAAPSGEIPTTLAPERLNAERFSLNWQASLVQPGVSSAG